MKINRLNDLFFKYLLGSDERKDLTLNFLNAILADGDRRFESIEFTNKDLEPEADAGKLSKLDIRGVLDNGELTSITPIHCRTRMQIIRHSASIWKCIFWSFRS